MNRVPLRRLGYALGSTGSRVQQKTEAANLCAPVGIFTKQHTLGKGMGGSLLDLRSVREVLGVVPADNWEKMSG